MNFSEIVSSIGNNWLTIVATWFGLSVIAAVIWHLFKKGAGRIEDKETPIEERK